MSEELFGRRTRFPHVHRAISLRQSRDDGALNQALAEAKASEPQARTGSGRPSEIPSGNASRTPVRLGEWFE